MENGERAKISHIVLTCINFIDDFANVIVTTGHIYRRMQRNPIRLYLIIIIILYYMYSLHTSREKRQNRKNEPEKEKKIKKELYSTTIKIISYSLAYIH